MFAYAHRCCCRPPGSFHALLLPSEVLTAPLQVEDGTAEKCETSIPAPDCARPKCGLNVGAQSCGRWRAPIRCHPFAVSPTSPLVGTDRKSPQACWQEFRVHCR